MSPDLQDLMLTYARRGLEDWDRLRGPTKEKIRALLRHKVIEKEGKLHHRLGRQGTSERDFVPMPSHPDGRGMTCLFSPAFKPNGDFQFNVFSHRDGNDWFGYRYESAHRGMHCYPHAQLTSVFYKHDPSPISPPMPERLGWIPDSYPSFPTACSDPTDVFLVLMVAFHGFEGQAAATGGAGRVLKEAYQRRGSPLQMSKYLERITVLVAG